MKKSTLALVLVIAIGMSGCSENNAGSQASTQYEAIPAAHAAEIKDSATGVRSSRTNPENATALGIEVGYANLAGAKRALKGKIELSESESDTGFIVLSGDGDAGVPGVQSLQVLIDQKSDVVQAIILAMAKDPVTVANNLSQKYTVKESKIDTFMNKGDAKYEKGDTEIYLEAPHLSFIMNVSYGTKAFWKRAFDLANQQQNDAKVRLSEGL